MADYAPVVSPATAFTQTASAAVTGGQVVANSGDGTVAAAAAVAVAVVGVAAHDAASGARVTVHRLSGVVHESTASGAVTAGALLAAGDGGTVAVLGATPAAGQLIGVALAAAADGAKVRWLGK